MNYSYWEKRHYTKKFDLLVVGAGIVGLNAAITFKEKNPLASVLVLERGLIPNGASTKNAGFACFGSAGELLDDLHNNKSDLVWETLQMRYLGLQLLRQRIGDKAMNYEPLGGFEVFTSKNDFEAAENAVPSLNKAISEAIGRDCFKLEKKKDFGLGPNQGIIKNTLEAQIDTGLMMDALLKLARKKDIEVLYGIDVRKIEDHVSGCVLETALGQFAAHYCIIATNAFAAELAVVGDLVPGRAQVLVTSPIKDLKLKGSFHLEKGYYYFRNIDNRVLLGGGRNLDFENEQTFENATTQVIQNKLEELLTTLIIPGIEFEIEHRWSGIMGLGTEKKPIVKKLNRSCVIAVRMGGMGVAIGSLVGQKAAELVSTGLE